MACRTSRRTWRPFRHSLTWCIGALASDIDIVAVAREVEESRTKTTSTIVSEEPSGWQPLRWTRYLWALVVCAVTTLLALPLQPHFDLANIVMLFLLAVVIVAVRLGRGPATLAAVLNVSLTDRPTLDLGIAQWVYDRSEPAGLGTDTLPGSPALYLPLKAPLHTRGVLVVEPTTPRVLMIPEQRRQLDIFTALIAIDLERVHFVTIAREALIRMESERLRNSLLSALSHDLRTPLTALVGLADSLALSQPALSAGQAELAAAIREQALRTSELVNKVLDMARLQVCVHPAAG